MHGGRAETTVGTLRPQRANPLWVSDVGRGSLQIPRRFRGLLRPLSVLRSPTSRLRELPERPTLIGNGDHVVGIVGQLPTSKLVGLPVGLPSFAPPTRRPHVSDFSSGAFSGGFQVESRRDLFIVPRLRG